MPATLGDDQSPHLFLHGTAPHPMAELFSTPFPLTPLGGQVPHASEIVPLHYLKSGEKHVKPVIYKHILRLKQQRG